MKKIFTLIFTVALLSNCFASVVYTYVSEAVYPTTRYYDIDLDGDNDFSFSYNGTYYEVTCSKNSSEFAADGTTGTTPKAYNSGAALGTHHWHSGVGALTGSGMFTNTSKYLMVRFSNTSGNVFYAWIYLYHASGTLIINEYAYDNTPNQTIMPGNLGQTAIEKINGNDFQLFVKKGHIEVSAVGNYTVTLTNLNGQQLIKSVSGTPLNTNDFSPGVYFVSLQDENNNRITRKVVLQ